MRIFEHLPHIDFMKAKGIAFATSWAIILTCFLWIHPWKGAASHVKLGMQFTGGIDMMVQFTGDIHQDALRKALQDGGVANAAVVAYADRPGLSLFSIKVKARKGQDAKDSSAQIDQIIAALRGIDPGAASDHRPDLNTESVGAMLDTWSKANPLGVTGEDSAIRQAYEPWISKVTRA
jgi:preprotein translocase subunit SecF